MRYLLLALFGAFFVTPALAADWPFEKASRVGGGVIVTGPSTVSSIDFGFTPGAVQLCFKEGGTAGTIVYLQRQRGAVSEATSVALFRSGVAGNAPAATISAGGDGTDSRCEIYPLAARYLGFNSTLTATIDALGLAQ